METNDQLGDKRDLLGDKWLRQISNLSFKETTVKKHKNKTLHSSFAQVSRVAARPSMMAQERSPTIFSHPSPLWSLRSSLNSQLCRCRIKNSSILKLQLRSSATNSTLATRSPQADLLSKARRRSTSAWWARAATSIRVWSELLSSSHAANQSRWRAFSK